MAACHMTYQPALLVHTHREILGSYRAQLESLRHLDEALRSLVGIQLPSGSQKRNLRARFPHLQRALLAELTGQLLHPHVQSE